MKLLEKKMLTIYIQRVKSPNRMGLKEYAVFYYQLALKYKNRPGLKIVPRTGYEGYTNYWLAERRMETDAELTKRQSMLDAQIAKQKVLSMKQAAERKARRQRQQQLEKERNKLRQQRELAEKLNEMKLMVTALKQAGYTISQNKA